MNIKQYLDSTYLKTPSQAGLSEAENTIIAKEFIQESIDENFKLIMIRPNMVSLANKMITDASISDVQRDNNFKLVHCKGATSSNEIVVDS